MKSSITHAINGEYIREWLVLGPFFPHDLERDFLADVGGEANLCPYEGMSFTASDGEVYTWKRYKSESHIINLLDAMKQLLLSNVYSESSGAVCYVACNILSPKTQSLEMVLERFDGVKVWMNGSLIHSSPEPNRWDKERFGIPLKAGENRCLIKVGQYIAGIETQWGFSAQVQDYAAYLRSLELKLTVRRQNPDGRDELTISARREPQSAVWELPFASVQTQIRGESEQLLETLQSHEGEPVVWTVPEEAHGSIRILAVLTDASGKTYEEGFACQAHNIIPVTPQVGRWETIDVADGLGGPIVLSILQDRNGALWFGLWGEGVCRYDGRTFRTFTTQDGLPSNDIWTIFEDSRGDLWFGTMNYWTWKGAGVCKYDGKTFQTFTKADGLAGDVVTAIYEDNRGHLWFGTGAGVSRFDGEMFQNYTAENGFPSGAHGVRVGAITQDQAGDLWFANGIKAGLGVGYGVTRYDGSSFRNFTTEDGLVDNDVNAIITDAHGNLWLGTYGGVSFYDGKTFQNFTTAEGLVHNAVYNVFQTEDGDMWFATMGGVSRYHDDRFQNFTIRDGLVHNRAWCITEDREGDLWFGTSNGVSRYDRSVKNIPVDTAGGIRDTKGNLWFPVPGIGLGRYDGKNIRTFAREDGLLDNDIRGIHEDSRGNIWIGAITGGLARYDGEKFRVFTTRDGLSSNYVWCIREDREGILWIGMLLLTGMDVGGGICTYDGKRFVKVAGKRELGEERISRIIEDRKGNMWFSMPGYGVCRYDRETFTRFNTTNGLPNNTSFSLLEDRRGNIWIATEGGLCRYDGKVFKTFTTEDGLAGNRTERLFEDSRGNLWFGVAGAGIHKFDGNNFQIFTTDDGLMSNSGQTLEDEAGNMIFVTTSGITIYTPPRESISPPIAVTEVVADKVYPAPERLKIPSTTPRISFSYYGASFKTRRMRYNYMLEGYDADWQATWNENVSYENLEPGDYVFKVIAIDRDLNYSEPASVKLEVIPDPRDLRVSELESDLMARDQQLAILQSEIGKKYHFQDIIGDSDAMKQVRGWMEHVIDSDVNVLVTGETGTGKELVAKGIHYNSPRKDKLPIPYDCGAISRELVASELFGHKKGAFTGAIADRIGLFETAEGSTVILDEMGNMPLDIQANLLRVLEERKVQRLGENISRDIDVRVIAMTDRDLLKEIAEGRFREALYYRVNGFHIHIPPLRDRDGDIPLLAEHFYQEACLEQKKELDGFVPGVMDMLDGYSWPGNVRELRNEIHRACLLTGEGSRIQTYHFSSHITQGESLVQEILSEQTGLSASVERLQRRMIEDALRESDGNRSQAARILGLHQPNLVRLMKRLGME